MPYVAPPEDDDGGAVVAAAAAGLHIASLRQRKAALASSYAGHITFCMRELMDYV